MAGRNVYRMDGRTEEEFIEDIKRGTQREQLAIELFQDYLYWEHGFIEPIKDNGIDMDGGYIEDMQEVNTSADYIVGGELLEVKTCPNHSSIIYLKVDQIFAYVKQGASLLFVNGLERDIPAFTMFTPRQMEKFNELYKVVNPPRNVNGGKRSYELHTKDFPWLTFDGKEKVYVK